MNNRSRATLYAIGLSTICLLNKNKLFKTENKVINLFCNGYLNDILGTTIFLLYLSIVLSFLKKTFTFKFAHIVYITLFCGILWEYFTPLYRYDTVSDPIDIPAYMVGGIFFWYFCDGNRLMNNRI